MTYLISGKKGKSGDFQWSAVQSERVSGALNFNAPGDPWLQAHLIAPEPDSTWLHLIAPDWTWWHLITPGSTWLHLVAPDCTWAWLHLIGSSTGFTWLKCTCLLALQQYFLNLTAFESTSSRAHCIFVCFGPKNSLPQNGICLQNFVTIWQQEEQNWKLAEEKWRTSETRATKMQRVRSLKIKWAFFKN